MTSTSKGDRGTTAYFRNWLNVVIIKGEVRNAYRPYKLLYYTILDATCCVLFFQKFSKISDEEIPLPNNFQNLSSKEKIAWFNGIWCEEYFFESQTDIMKDLIDILTDMGIVH